MEKTSFGLEDFKIATKKEAKLLHLIETCKEALLDNEIDDLLRHAIIFAAQKAIDEEKKDLNT